MEPQQHYVKSVNTDTRSNKRLRYASAKERSKRASADVYRSYKRRLGGSGLTSASTREESVHHSTVGAQERLKKKQRETRSDASISIHDDAKADDDGAVTSFKKGTSRNNNMTAVVRLLSTPESTNDVTARQIDEATDYGVIDDDVAPMERGRPRQDDESVDNDEEAMGGAPHMSVTTFATELDAAIDRNGSEVFSKFHRQLWILVRSLPEVLHHLPKIVELMCSYLLSPASLPERPSPAKDRSSKAREEFVTNHATTDILHLLSVLARDLRHELHPYLHTDIIPRIVQDLLNPPPPPSDSGKQPIPLDVTIVESAFRTLSYILRYDSTLIVQDMESMRKYYGMTLGSRRELVRRLSAETFAPLIRKIKSQSARERHVRRVLRALASTAREPPTRVLQRTQADAVDGLSELLYQIVRGVPGRLHSQGGPMLRFLLEYLGHSDNRQDPIMGSNVEDESTPGDDTQKCLVFDVVSGVVTKLCYHFHGSSFVVVTRELFAVFDASVRDNVHPLGMNLNETKKVCTLETILHYLKLIVQVVSFRNGELLRGHWEKDLCGLGDSVATLCSEVCFPHFGIQFQTELVSLLCQIWIPVQDRECLNVRKCITSILNDANPSLDSLHCIAVTLARKLWPFLEEGSRKGSVAEILLTSAAHIAELDIGFALEVVFAMAVAVASSTDTGLDGNNREFSLYGRMKPGACTLGYKQQQVLLDSCLSMLESCQRKNDDYAGLSVTIRCIPFLALLLTDSEIEKEGIGYIQKSVNALMEIIELPDNYCIQEKLVVTSLALEAVSFLLLQIGNLSRLASVTKKTINRLQPKAEKLALLHRGSLWVMRGVSSLIPLLNEQNIRLSDDVDLMLDSLVSNLGDSNHFLRLYTLRILASYPEKSFVVDHADIDLSGDLDEDHSPFDKHSPSHLGPVGRCDLLKTLLEIEESRVTLVNERKLLSLLARVEVLARTRRLPEQYAEAAVNHMLGLFYVKFSPLWPVAGKTIVALATAHEDVAWPPFEAKLCAVMNHGVVDGNLSDEPTGTRKSGSFMDHFDLLCNWEKSRGTNIALFEKCHNPCEGEVPCWHVTDQETVMESVWKAAELGHKVVVKHSRVIVPLFLGFLHNQFFSFHVGDQNARELRLHEVVQTENFDCHRMEAFVLQKRLKAFLGAFAAIEGPRQLVQNRLLENIFRSFLSDQDPSVVELSLTCLSKYKLEYLLPYAGLIKDMVQKGKLRPSLLKLTEVVDSGSMSQVHRKMMIPLLSRILFGRITSKAAKNSKDSPAARRAAILSFLSNLCGTEDDLFPFVYMMTRSFMPRPEKLKVMECYNKDDREAIMQVLLRTRSEDLATLSSGVIEGFLHLLDSIISQLGYRIESWVPQFTKITLELANLVSVKNEIQSIEATEEQLGVRRSPIRALCFQRLGNLFARFSTTVDFGVFSPLIWSALEPSLVLLPEMVTGNEGCPSLLLLLQSMSSDSNLIRLMLNHDDAVRAVFRCIAPTSKSTVMHSSLTFVENLLSISDKNSSIAGVELVRRHSPLLIEQFTMRFGQRSSAENVRAINPGRRNDSRNSTWRRELEILFRISSMIADGDAKEASCLSNISVLCNLLVPLLQADQGTSDEDKVRLTRILDGFVGQLDSAAAFSVFSELSRSLAPFKSKAGIPVLAIRRSIASLIATVATRRPELRMVSSVLLNLTSTEENRVDEIDFAIVLPELNSLGAQGSGSVWKSLCSHGNSGPSVLEPLINTCFNFLYSDDGVLVRASFNAIKALVLVIANEGKERIESDWTKLAESRVMPLVRSGILCHDSQIRRHFILLTREISREFHLHPSRNLCGDLDSLRNDENQDLDFFLSITHVQIHRRSRAFQRLRKSLSLANSDDVGPSPVLTSQSLSNILLPLALHPVYECKTKLEESYALEAVATLQALSRHLSWSKYNNLLWTLMSQFDRYAEQERFLVGAMCAVIDGFSYEILEKTDDGFESNNSKTSVWRSLENRLLPKLEELLTKETKDKNGSRIKILRPPIILALMKLLQKFPVDFFESKLPRVLSVICDALRSKDSNVRDVARTTLSRMVCSMDMKYLVDVVREITITLNEGYKLHVRAAVMHSILLDLSKVYEPPTADSLEPSDTLQFDAAVPAIMDLLQEDLFGEANDRMESRETSVRYVKEAGGTKSFHSVEIVCKMIAFTPAAQPRNGKLPLSSIHCIVSPLLERLRSPDIDLRMIRKVREVLSRVVMGLSSNKSVRTDQLFPFVYATIEPFIGSDAIAAVKQNVESEDDGVSDDEAMTLRVSGRKEDYVATTINPGTKTGKVVEWRPSTLKASGSAATASDIKKEERRQLLTVRDGTSAPKLTGSSRNGQIERFNNDRVNEPATISAVIFGLNLMNACLKRKEIRQGHDSLSMLDPFVPMLTACVCHCRDTDVALIALKCLLTFLSLDLPSIPACAKSLGIQTLSLLSSAGSSKNQNHDLVQACFKTLTHLISTDRESDESSDDPMRKARVGEEGPPSNYKATASEDGDGVFRGLRRMPLTSEQMRVLISLLQVSITETEQHNPALGLIKAILSRRYVSPEFYDMLESILKLVVRSHKVNLRHQCAGLFVRYLLDYPMGEERFEKHLKQVVANISYEFEEGRLSAIILLTLVIEKLPEELLQKHAQLLFLPLVLQLVNDDSKECRGRVSCCIEVLLKRSSLIALRTFHEYCVRWSQQPGALRLASMQIFGLIADTRSDFIQTSLLAESWSMLLENQLRQREKADWETTYFSLVAVEKLWQSFAQVLSSHPDLWTYVTDSLAHPHPWIKLSSSRILNRILSSQSAKSFLEEKRAGLLFDIVRNLTSQLNVSEEEQSEEISELAIKTLTAAVSVMKGNPQMCYAAESSIRLEEQGSPGTCEKQDPVFWLLRRLSQIVRNKGSKRRVAVFKCYAAFVANNYEAVAPHLELMLEGLHRSATEAKNEIELRSISMKRKTSASVAAITSTGNSPALQEAVVPTTEYSTAEDVLRLIEDNCNSPEEFLNAYAAVKRRARDKKEKRKIEEKAEAVHDPQAAAVRKIKKQERNKERRKRRNDEYRWDRGGADKKQRRTQFL